MKQLFTPQKLVFLEIVFLVGAAEWGQSATGTAFLKGHPAVFDIVMALYTGWRAAERIQKANASFSLTTLNLNDPAAPVSVEPAQAPAKEAAPTA